MDKDRSKFYRYRFINFIEISFGWFLYYFCRKTFIASMPELIRHGGFDKTDLGTISSSFTIVYGISKLVSGILSDYLSGKLLLALGLFLSGICCLLFPLFESILILSILWGCNGFIQGLGWAGCAKLLKCWYDRGEIATWWSLASAAGNIGATLTPLTFAYVSFHFGWQHAYHFTGMAACTTGVLLWLLLRDSPPLHLNVPSFLTGTTAKETVNTHIWYEILFQIDVWIVCLSYFMFSMIRYCVTDWSQLYYIEAAELTEARAAACVSTYQVGGVVGSILIGYLSDVYIGQEKDQVQEHPRAPALFLNSVFVIAILHMLSSVVLPGVSEIVLTVIQFCAGGFIEGSNTIIGLVAMDCVIPELSGSSHAMASFLAQFGAFFAGLPFGYLIKTLGWNYAYLMLESVALANILLCSYLLIKHYSNGVSEIAVKKRE